MAHTLRKIYQEKKDSWAIVCSCGWKEKAHTEKECVDRLMQHQRTMPKVGGRH